MYEEQEAKIETMTIQEVYEALQRLGVRTTPVKFRAAIAQGAYPFGICVNMKEQSFEIYRTLFDKWVAERLTPAS
ncbi:MAG: hypothetical protein EGR97_13205 [Clostridiales bacterium]|nr:hypothetical protein [Clostridiales bacterium]